MNLTIKPADLSNPYGEMMANFFAQDFPGANITNKGSMLEALTAAFIASGQVRYGPAPNPESLVAIRAVIRDCIENNKPLPILVPWGSKKTKNYESVDVAELGALKQLACLQKRVTSFFAPGIQVRMRMEDVSGYSLFMDEIEHARPSTIRYCKDFSVLVRALGMDSYVEPILESTLFLEEYYAATTKEYLPLFVAYLMASEDGPGSGKAFVTFEDLRRIGWQGNIPAEQRNFYYQRYRANYPGITTAQAIRKLALYFATNLARIQYKGTADDPAWLGKYLAISFVGPVPGVPALNSWSRRIFYRTLPTKMADTHIPAWRAKGYLKVGSQIIPKLASWNEKREYNRAKLVFTRGEYCVDVAADYVVDDSVHSI